MDWVTWHGGYDDPRGSLAKRLGVVRCRIGEALDLVDQSRPRVLSLCAGDGRDVIPVLAARSGSTLGAVVLVEQDLSLATAAVDAAAAASLAEVDVRHADAADPGVWADGVPVDVLLLCGIFGNVSAEEADALVTVAPALLRPGGCVVWTRGRTDPDLRPRVREAFTTAGFEEVAYDGEPATYGVGLARLAIPPPEPTPALPDRLFTFLR